MTRKPVTVSIVSHEHGDEIPLLLGDLAEFATPDIHEVIVTSTCPSQRSRTGSRNVSGHLR